MANSGSVEVRNRRGGDLEELIAVARRVRALDDYPISLPDSDFGRFLTSPTPVGSWVATQDQAIVGHVALNETTSPPVMELVASLEPLGRVLYVARLLVDPHARREGVGRRLLSHATTSAAGLGAKAMLDVVDRPAAAAAIALYRSEGWEEVGRVHFSRDIDELVFRAPS